VFARKNYFYPDLPKGYQISQYEEPLATSGWLDVALGENGDARTRRVRLNRIHMEEDAGKSIHDAAIAGDATHVDLNRAGVPLLEIVSEPDLRSPSEAAAYLRALRQLLRDVDASDADMERGNFRCDANVSLRRHGAEQLGIRAELKNLNSFRFVEAALEAEILRQAEILDGGGRVVQATLAFDPDTGRTRVLRLKENADDYRYFPDPDLVPLQISEEQVEAVRAGLPELADARSARFVREHGLGEEDARLLCESRALADFFETAAARHGAGAELAKWIRRDLLRVLGEQGLSLETSPLTPQAFADLVALVARGATTAASARSLLPELLRAGGDPERLVRERGLEAVSDTGSIEAAVDAVLREHPDHVARLRGGEEKVRNFLIGQVMKRTGGKADPAAVRSVLTARLSEGA
jgi:aspartyl-tRNA(Asn)/glutamyl-tRNA(Gln) amidotransferase subunit B